MPPKANQFLHSYQSPPPATALQSLADHGTAPYGYTLGSTPELIVPQPEIAAGPQPVYHLKVTATPVELPRVLPPEGPEYVVTASPTGAQRSEVATAKQGETVIAHAAPVHENVQSISIRPANLEAAHERELQQSKAPKAGRSISMRSLPSRRGRSFAPEDRGSAYVHVYAGAGAVDTRDILKRIVPGRSAQLAFSDTPLLEANAIETAMQSAASRPLEAEAFEDEEKPKMYNWIIPAGGSADMATASGEDEASFRGRGIDQEQQAKLDSLFAQASAELTAEHNSVLEQRAMEERDRSAQGSAQILSTPTDDELGLPNELRPSVIYGGVEHAPPEYAGTKGPLKYKLHAIEVHQYIPIPDAKEPWLIQSNMNPATTAVFGPMPMPFDPAHSGMVAPTFQRTIGLQPVPMLSPEVSRMFNHELPVVSNLLDALPPAETAS